MKAKLYCGMLHVVLIGGIFLSLFAPWINVAPVARVLADSPQDQASGSASLPSSTPPMAASASLTHTIRLKSREFQPVQSDLAALQELSQSERANVHVLVRLDFIPRQAAKDELKARGLELLAYVPDYAWIASVPANNPASAMQLPGVTWAGELMVNDKLDPAILGGEWGSYNLAPDGTVAVYVAMHLDETLDTGHQLVAAHGGKVTGEVKGINLLMVEMPVKNVRALAAEEAVQWIEAAEPPLDEANDGIRQQIGVNTVQAAPYNLNGSGIDILIYDGGIITATHADFSGRITVPDVASVSDHATHVAGTAAGSGSLSASAGGSALQWRGMAPGADIISYAYEWNGQGMLFYNNPGDIEADWAAAQNTYGADVGNASLSSNIYLNYPMSCTLMGNYGVTSNLMDQIIRGGNSVVGIGDKYIATWAAGNERPSACSATGYGTSSPPAGAKNPIHVGASNTNDNSMTTFSSWGPTDDGRIKPIVVAGGEQIGGDNGIKSTIPNMFTNNVSRNCDGSGDDYCYPYDTMQGTSMASPAVAGSIALMLQHYRAVYNTSGNFWPSTAKAILMQTADDLGNPGPDYQWGFGQVDIVAAVNLISRTAFIEDAGIAQGAVEVYYFPVFTNTTPAQVTLVWDDFEATFNANPTLINNLDLELVAPSGTIWRPWILDPANPANNATRGVNTRDNQEQVTVSSPEIGTWMVRVKGTTVPQGPQYYSLACEGCKPLNAGVCQFKVDGTLVASSLPGGQGLVVNHENGEVLPALPQRTPEALTAGELWQRKLEAQLAGPDALAQADREALAMLEAALNAGPEAVLALRDQLTGRALDLAMDEIQKAQKLLSPPAPVPTEPNQVAAVNRVGINGACSYETIQQAVNVANNGDTIRVAAGMYFENVSITSGRTITIEGGYNSTCTATGAGATRTEGSAVSSNTFYISGGNTKLRNLQVAWGNGTFGAGIEALNLAQVTLDNTDVFNNHGTYAGGIYVSTNSAVTVTNGSEIHDNTATSDSGGVKVWGKFYGYSNDSDTHSNCAPNGGGFSVPGGHLYLNAADVYGNQAAGPTGKGGGIHVYSGGVVTLTNNVFVYFGNTAYDGAGLYADSASVHLTNSTFRDNTATNYGGGLYLTNNSALYATASSIGQAATGLYNEAARGAGIYAVTSTINFAGSIINNLASNSGGGLYASNSTVNLIGATVGGAGTDLPNQLGTSGHEGVGLYLTNNTQATLSDTVVASNTFQTTGWGYGGGMLVEAGSVVTLTNSRVERHVAPSSEGRGAGIYVRDATVTLDNSQVLSNTTAVGGGVRLWSNSTLNVKNGSSLINNQALSGNGGAISASGLPTITISNATLQYNTAGTDGGAIYLDAGTLGLTGWWDVQSNHAAGNGGAVAIAGTGDAGFYVTSGAQQTYLATNHADGNGGALYVTNGTYVQLYATGAYPLNLKTNFGDGNGGAAYANGGATFDFYGLVNANGNQAVGNGGVFYLSGGSRVWLDDWGNTRPQIWSNQAQNGGVVYAQAGSIITCDGSDVGTSVNGNSATAGSGGAFYLSGSTLADNNCVFRDNQATLSGGAIAAYTSTVTIDADFASLATADGKIDPLNPAVPQAEGCNPANGPCSSLYGNRADSDTNGTGDGGAIYANASALNVSYTYLHRNRARLGGAIYQTGAGATTQVNNSLIYSNTVSGPSGAGIRTYQGALTVTHVTLANNVGGASLAGDLATSNVVSNSIAWGNPGGGFSFAAGTFTYTCNIDQSGNAGANVDPRFVAPGAGENYRLQSLSPAVDACNTGLPRDLENRSRPFGSRYDMGAYEWFKFFIYLPVVLK